MEIEKPKENSTRIKEPRDNSKKGMLDIKALGIVDNIVFTKTNAFAFYKVTNVAFEYLSIPGKQAVIARTINAFSHIMGESSQALRCKVIGTSNPVDVEMWENQVRSLVDMSKTAPGFEEIMFRQKHRVLESSLERKATYIAIDLGKRGALDISTMNPIELGIKEAWNKFKDWLSKSFQLPKEEFSAEEENYFKSREQAYAQALRNGSLQARRMTSEEILLNIKRQFWPYMPAPYLDVDYENRIGLGDIVFESGSNIDARNGRYLKITQMINGVEASGYRATLSIAKLPKVMEFGYTPALIHSLAEHGLPFPWFIDLTLIPHKKVQKELEDQKKMQIDEETNLREAGAHSLPVAFQEAVSDAKAIDEILNEDKSPWVDASYHIVVEAPTLDELNRYCDKVIQSYKDLDVIVKWTSGDQIDLFLSQMPGDGWRVKDFVTRNDLNILGLAGINYSSEVGDLINGEEN